MTDALHRLREWLPADAACALMPSHRVVTVSGADAAGFLQGQFSNDIDALDANPGQLSSWSSAKGRVLAFLRVLKLGDDFRLVVDAGIADAFVQRLRMFVLRSKVTIDIDDAFEGMALAGASLPQRLAASGLPSPAAGEAVAYRDCVFLGLPGPAPRVEIYGPKGALPPLDIPAASQDDLARWDILFGLPRITDANRDAHVAQHLNLDELGAISFRKGCYTGQEIIARMKYLGRVKKRAMVFLGEGANVGDTIRGDNDRAVGDVVNAASADGRQLLLAVVNLEDGDGELRVNGASLERLPHS